MITAYIDIFSRIPHKKVSYRMFDLGIAYNNILFYSLVRVQERIQSGLEVLQYYTTKEWKFSNDNFKLLPKLVKKKDRETYFMDIKQVDWHDYILKYVLGAREYCLKEPPSNLPHSRKLLKRFVCSIWLNTKISVIFSLFKCSVVRHLT